MAFINNIQNEYPSELLETRHITEGNIIACLWGNNELYKDLKDLKENDFITEEAILYYRIGLGITNKGVVNIDKSAIYTYLEDKPTIKEMFEEYGGYESIKDLVNSVNVENYEAYFDELIKNNALLSLYKRIDVLKNLPKLKQMTSKQTYDWFDYMISDTFIKVNGNLKPIDLTTGYDKYFSDIDKGKQMGIPIESKLLSYHLAGLHRGNILLHTAHSGVGKTSSTIVLYILPLLKQHKKVVILVNEQGEDQWRQMLIPSIITHQIYPKTKDNPNNMKCWLERQRMQYGNFTDEEWVKLRKAQDWLKQYEGNLIFYPLEDYSSKTLKQIIKKLMRIDPDTTFILDTWKPSDETGDKAWAQFTEDSKDLYKIVRPEEVGGLNVRMICTAQLSGATLHQRYLDVSCLAKSKGIKEVVGQNLMFRRVWQDEYNGEKHEIKPYNKIQLSDGTWSNNKQYFTLNPDKEYTICFIDKNRYGKDNFQLLFETNLDYNYWKCIGYCTVKQDY